ncbi:MAG: hypothetical protein LBB18_04480 [Puniceicoccales bacterium]|jgi:hypothetical protein|nr:hypothetical protein [Puniceicoccales bacterium]
MEIFSPKIHAFERILIDTEKFFTYRKIVECGNVTGFGSKSAESTCVADVGQRSRRRSKLSPGIGWKSVRFVGGEKGRLRPPPEKVDANGNAKNFSRMKVKVGAKSNLWKNIPKEAKTILEQKQFSVLARNRALNAVCGFFENVYSPEFAENFDGNHEFRQLVRRILNLDVNEPQISNEDHLQRILESINDRNRDLLLPITKGIRNQDGSGCIDPQFLCTILGIAASSAENRDSIGRIFSNSQPGELRIDISKMTVPSHICNLFDTGNVFRADGDGVTLNPDVRISFELFFPIISLLAFISDMRIESSKSRNPKVLAIEKKMQRIGTTMTFADDLKLARATWKAVAKVKKVTGEAPPLIFLFSDRVKFPWLVRAMTLLFSENYMDIPLIFISKFQDLTNPGLDEELYNNLFELTDSVRKGSINPTLEGVMLHEFGHFYHLRTGSIRENVAKWRTIFSGYAKADSEQTESEREMSELIRKEVSKYALFSYDGQDLVAEVFCGLMSGKNFSHKIMDLYRELDGPMFDFDKLKSTAGKGAGNGTKRKSRK